MSPLLIHFTMQYVVHPVAIYSLFSFYIFPHAIFLCSLGIFSFSFVKYKFKMHIKTPKWNHTAYNDKNIMHC